MTATWALAALWLGLALAATLLSIWLRVATALSEIVVGAIAQLLIGAVVGEYLGSARGVGYLILQAEGVFDINTVFAGILVLTACALLLDVIVTHVEARLLVWRPRAAETEAL